VKFSDGDERVETETSDKDEVIDQAAARCTRASCRCLPRLSRRAPETADLRLRRAATVLQPTGRCGGVEMDACCRKRRVRDDQRDVTVRPTVQRHADLIPQNEDPYGDSGAACESNAGLKYVDAELGSVARAA